MRSYWWLSSSSRSPLPMPTPATGCETLTAQFSVDILTTFGLFAVTAMLVCYALEAAAIGSFFCSLSHARSVPSTASFRARGRSGWSRPFGR
jgi:hypothetical protein